MCHFAMGLTHCYETIAFCRAMFRKRNLAVIRRMSVCLTRLYILSKQINTSLKFFHCLVATSFYFFHTRWYSDGNGGVQWRSGRQKLRLWAYIWLHCLLLTLQQTRCYQYGTAGPPTLIAGSKWQCWSHSSVTSVVRATPQVNGRKQTYPSHYTHTP